MFGYIVINKDELKIREWNTYRAYYCGLCQSLKALAGGKAQLTLTYDMTFLALLLDSLYECEQLQSEVRCVAHPVKKHPFIQTEASDYAAAMNVLLCYDNLLDDWFDDRNLKSRVAAGFLKKIRNKIAAKYPRQAKAVADYLKKLHELENKKEANPDACAGATGEMLAEIFAWKEDEWAQELKRVGFYLGKFIYLMDAFEDLEKDKRTGSYNPFALYQGEIAMEDYAGQILNMMAAEASRAFERLPIVENIEILRNVLYAGAWTKYEAINQRKSSAKSDAKCSAKKGAAGTKQRT